MVGEAWIMAYFDAKGGEKVGKCAQNAADFDVARRGGFWGARLKMAEFCKEKRAVT